MKWPKPVIEGPVKIAYVPSEDSKVKMQLEIDYAKTTLDPHQAAKVNKTIIDILRDNLDVVLNEFH